MLLKGNNFFLERKTPASNAQLIGLAAAKMAESAMPVNGDYFNLQTIKEETKQLPEKNKFALEALPKRIC